MAEPTEDVLKRDIYEIVKDADLTQLTSKKVRLQLSEKYGCDLQHRRTEIDNLLMDIITNKQASSSSHAKSSTKADSSKKAASSSSSSHHKAPKRSASPPSLPKKKAAVASNGAQSSDEDSAPDNEVMDDEELARKLQEEWDNDKRTRNSLQSKPKKPEKKKKEKKPKGEGKRPNKYMEPCILSSALAEVVGEPRLPRHEVVKKIWSIVKERNLQDPKNRQFMIPDDQLGTIFGQRKKVRIFGMMKYLTEHIFSPRDERLQQLVQHD